MDREMLLEFFRSHYLSRQEVLFKLPLSVSIDTFWPELLSRRKASAILLPLLGPTGMPYWYVLTDKMVAASERLCAEAMAQGEEIDPYRMQMTSAMTEEMFFTSFVEGAQIPLREAMDFLQRGTEPESIQEQMIWNNRHAWAELAGKLYQPLDEGFVKTLAFMLTEEMDNCAEDYRQTDSHSIVAMNGEPYEVPRAACLPDRMMEFYSFLQNGGIHPLIKAAAGQAYLLVTRPFPEGNERLSRMISSAVLLRSGYDFFRDISISGVIARESYRYYKSMKEIIRTENGGDMTYFMEYYLELLVRALDSHKDREKRRAQDVLTREREMAREPLQQSDMQNSPYMENAEEHNLTGEIKEEPDRKAEAWPLQSLESFLEQVDRLKYSPKQTHREYPVKIHRMINHGLIRFNVNQWSVIQGVERKRADYECRVLYQRGLTDRHPETSPLEYSFRISENTLGQGKRDDKGEMKSRQDESDENVPLDPEEFESKLKKFEHSKSEMKQRTAEVVRSMISRGISSFARQEWQNYTGLKPEHAKDSCDAMVANGMIVNTSLHARPAVYQFNFRGNLSNGGSSQILMDRLRKMAGDERDPRDYRIGTFLLERIEKGVKLFTTTEWRKRFAVSKSMSGNDLRRAMNLGLVKKQAKGTGIKHGYSICTNPEENVRNENLTDMQKEYLTMLYDSFREKEFSVEDCARLLGQSGSAVYFHLNNFMERGILAVNRTTGSASKYLFAVTSEDHPECFRQVGNPMETSKEEGQKSEAAMAIAGSKVLTVAG